MEIIPNIELYIDYTLTIGASSPHDDFDGSHFYWKRERVYSNPSDGGDGNNYELQWWWYNSSTRPENNTSAWKLLGTAEFSIASYVTDHTISFNQSWSSGSSVNAGAYQYFNKRNYLALTNISSGDNTITPEAAVIAADEDVAARWADAGPSNAFRCLDDEVATATRHVGPSEVTLRGRGATDRICFWALTNISAVSVEVSAGEYFQDPDFTTDASEWSTVTSGATLSVSSGQMDISYTGYASGESFVYTKVPGLIVGRQYRFEATVSCDAADEWQLFVNLPSGSRSATQTGSGTLQFDFTAQETTQQLRIYMLQGTQDISVTSVSLKDNDHSTETVSKTLEDSTSGVVRRHCVLAHEPLSFPQYVVSFSALHSVADTYIGHISAGMAREIGCTHAEVDVGNMSFSRLSDDKYGTARKVRNRAAKKFRAVVQLKDATLSGDLVDQVLHSLEGRDASFDFNNDTTDYARLQVHGWPESWSTIVTGLPDNDTLVIIMRSLVESIRAD